MARIGYLLLYPVLMLLSRLPFKVLYFLSDVLVFPLLYSVVGYRKKVVRENIKRSFSEKTDDERREIEVKFYHFISDLFLETIKGFTISEREMRKRYSVKNPEVLEAYFLQNQSIILSCGHYLNYESGATGIQLFFNHKVKIPYRKLTNPYFDTLFTASRSRFGAELFHTHLTEERLLTYKNELFALGLANDQAAAPGKAYWTRFLNQDTSFFIGTERLARLHNLPVVYLKLTMPKRGFYEMEAIVLSEKPREEKRGAIMEKHARMLENHIKEAPQYWLWTHRRWKHKRGEGVEFGFDLKDKKYDF